MDKERRIFRDWNAEPVGGEVINLGNLVEDNWRSAESEMRRRELVGHDESYMQYPDDDRDDEIIEAARALEDRTLEKTRYMALAEALHKLPSAFANTGLMFDEVNAVLEAMGDVSPDEIQRLCDELDKLPGPSRLDHDYHERAATYSRLYAALPSKMKPHHPCLENWEYLVSRASSIAGTVGIGDRRCNAVPRRSAVLNLRYQTGRRGSAASRRRAVAYAR